jgi:two-component system chemotaxis response regulator CheB
MTNRDLVVVGTSAGGFDALRLLASGLSADLPASLLVVIHLGRQRPSELDAILTRVGPFTASFAAEGDLVRHGHIHLAPPGRHLLLNEDGATLSLGTGPRENNTRPAIDPLFRSVALANAHRAIGVILTGTMNDGASGLAALKQNGGIAVVQDPDDAAFGEMPSAALRLVAPDYRVRLTEMAELLDTLVRKPAGRSNAGVSGLAYEVDMARGSRGSMRAMDSLARRSVLACPDCHGVLWEIDEGEINRYRCHVGHAYTTEMLKVALDENLHRAMGSALRALEERLALVQKLEQEAIQTQHSASARDWSAMGKDFEREIEIIRSAIARVNGLAESHKAQLDEVDIT